jgi:hypothetical protein
MRQEGIEMLETLSNRIAALKSVHTDSLTEILNRLRAILLAGEPATLFVLPASRFGARQEKQDRRNDC